MAPNPQRRACQVPGCNEDLSALKDYHRRYLICAVHLRSSSIYIEGVPQRFCQQCGKFHHPSAFNSTQRTCRTKLEQHNARRRKRQQHAEPQPSVGGQAIGILRPRHQSSSTASSCESGPSPKPKQAVFATRGGSVFKPPHPQKAHRASSAALGSYPDEGGLNSTCAMHGAAHDADVDAESLDPQQLRRPGLLRAVPSQHNLHITSPQVPSKNSALTTDALSPQPTWLEFSQPHSPASSVSARPCSQTSTTHIHSPPSPNLCATAAPNSITSPPSPPPTHNSPQQAHSFQATACTPPSPSVSPPPTHLQPPPLPKHPTGPFPTGLISATHPPMLPDTNFHALPSSTHLTPSSQPPPFTASLLNQYTLTYSPRPLPLITTLPAIAAANISSRNPPHQRPPMSPTLQPPSKRHCPNFNWSPSPSSHLPHPPNSPQSDTTTGSSTPTTTLLPPFTAPPTIFALGNPTPTTATLSHAPTTKHSSTTSMPSPNATPYTRSPHSSTVQNLPPAKLLNILTTFPWHTLHPHHTPPASPQPTNLPPTHPHSLPTSQAPLPSPATSPPLPHPPFNPPTTTTSPPTLAPAPSTGPPPPNPAHLPPRPTSPHPPTNPTPLPPSSPTQPPFTDDNLLRLPLPPLADPLPTSEGLPPLPLLAFNDDPPYPTLDELLLLSDPYLFPSLFPLSTSFNPHPLPSTACFSQLLDTPPTPLPHLSPSQDLLQMLNSPRVSSGLNGNAFLPM